MVLISLRLVLKREKDAKIVYSTNLAPDAEASVEHPPHPSPRVESRRAPVSSSALLSSSSHDLSAEADEVVNIVHDTGMLDQYTTGPEYTRAYIW